MPNRIIKESICESAGLCECSFFAIDLYKRLIVYADDYGRFNADTQIMLARLYPREMDCVTQEDLNAALIELTGEGKIAFYTSGPRKTVYGCFPNWSDHQRVRESKSKCPDPDDTTVNDWYLQRFIPMDMKIEIIERDGFKCQECGKFITSNRDSKRLAKHGSRMYHIDHIIPVVQGGRTTLENLRLTCLSCNPKRKKTFAFKEILSFAANSGELPQVAALIQSNPIQSKSNPESKSESKTSAFERFWEAYPKKVGKKDAQKAFSKVTKDVDALIDAVEKQKLSRQWCKDGGLYIPNPATWLNQERWNDELDENREHSVPQGASGQFGKADIEAIQKLLLEG